MKTTQTPPQGIGRSKVRFSETLLLRGLMLVGIAFLGLTLLAPLYMLFARALHDRKGPFVGLTNFKQYLATGGIEVTLANSLMVSLASTAIVLFFGFMAAWALTRTRLPGRSLVRTLLTFPILAPSLLPAISLVYLFGQQGILKPLLGETSIHGPLGIILGSCFWTFPHALMILLTSLSHADGRHYEAAESLKASPWRIFWTVTVPSARYGLVSAGFVVFTLVMTDFGVPKVIGGQFNVLATDIYKQVIGQQRFEMGAVIGVILLFPAILAFAADRWVQKKQSASLTARAITYVPPRSTRRDLLGMAFLTPTLLFICAIIGMAVYASFVTFWPYNLELSLANYQFSKFDGSGWEAYRNSLIMAVLTMLVGTTVVYFNAWLIERTSQPKLFTTVFQLLALMPMAVPGLALGLAYVFFFNHPDNPLNGLYGTFAILVICTLVHFYSVSHLTTVTALKQLDPEFESVGESLKSSRLRLLRSVTLPLSIPTILDVALYLFVNAMTTVSAVVFLYSPETRVASIAVLAMDEAGHIAPAAAMAVIIMLTCAAAKLIQGALGYGLGLRANRWRELAR